MARRDSSTEKTCAPARQASNGGDVRGEDRQGIGEDGWMDGWMDGCVALPKKLVPQPGEGDGARVGNCLKGGRNLHSKSPYKTRLTVCSR